MDFEVIKAGFQNYLTEKLAAEEGSEATTLNSSASIFMHSNEFKDYLVDEMGADISIFSKSINEIMDMEYSNGKLVEAGDDFITDMLNEALSDERVINTFDSDGNGILNEEEVNIFLNSLTTDAGGNITYENITQDVQNIQNGGFTAANIITEETETEEETAIEETATEEESAVAETEIEEESTIEETVTDEESAVAETETEEETEIEEETETEEESAVEKNVTDEDAIAALLENVYANKTVIKALDIDGDGELSDEEKAAFEEYIKGYDGDDSSLSQEDIKSAVAEIIEGTFSYETEETEIDVEETETEDTEATTSETTDSNSTSSTGSTSSTSSSSGTSSVSSSSYSTSTAEKTLDNMTLEELESEQATREQNVSSAREDINAVYSGENTYVKEAEENYEAAKEAYDAAVENDDQISDDLKQRREENLAAIEEEEGTIDDLNISINDKDNEISQQENVVAGDKATISGYKSSLSTLKSQSSDDEEKQAEIAQAIINVEAAIKAAETQLEADEEALDELEKEKADLEEQLETEEQNLEELETERSEIEEEILANCSEETKAALEAFNEAKDNVAAVKDEQLSIAQDALADAQASLDEVNDAIVAKKQKEAEKEYSVKDSSLDADLVEALDAQLGDGFCEKLEEICEEVGCNPEDLLGLMYSESSLNPSAVNSSSGATGLIQFIPSTAIGLGTTTSELKNMSAIEQLDYVEKYLKECNYYNYDEIDAGTLYSMVFLPESANSDVLCTSGSKYYSANSGLDIDGDGKITKSDLSARVESLYQTVLSQYT